MRTKIVSCYLVAFLGVLPSLPLCLQAATITWNGGGTNNLWTNAANWNGTAPVPGDDLVFPGGAGVDATSLVNTNNFPTNTPFRSITLTGTNYVLNGNPVIFTNINTSILIAQNGGGNNTVNLASRLDAYSFIVLTQTGGTFTVNGDVNFNNNGMVAHSEGNLFLGGLISGSGDLTKQGFGRVTMSGLGPNSYTGTTFVTQGNLDLANGLIIPAPAIPGPLAISPDSALTSVRVRLLRDNQIADAAPVTIFGLGVLDLVTNSDTVGELSLYGGVVTNGLLSLNGNVGVAASATAQIYSRLNLGAVSRTVSVTNAGFCYFHGAVGGSGGITKLGSGRLSLFASNSYSGLTVVGEGNIELGNSSALGSTNSGTVISNATTLFIRYNSRVGNEALEARGPGIFSQGALVSDLGTNSWAGVITLASNTTIQVFTTNDLLILSNAITGPGGLTKIGAGTVLFSGQLANTYSGSTFVSSGTLLLSKSLNMGAIPGGLTIGDGVGGVGADIVRLGASSQIADPAAVTIANSGQLELAGFSEIIGSLAGSGSVSLSNAVLTTGTNGASTTFSGVISGTNGGVVKNGLGSFTLSGTNLYTGITGVSNGRLNIDGFQPQCPVLVQNPGILGGSGTVGPITLLGGILSPGSSPGILTSSNLSMNATSTCQVELNGPLPGSGYDQLKARGTVSLAGNPLAVTLGYTPTQSTAFIIIDNDGSDPVISTFSGLPEGALFTAGGFRFQISYAGGSGSNDVVFTRMPEPSSTISSIVLSNGFAQLHVNGQSNLAYIIEGTTNLSPPISWVAVSTNTADGAGIYQFTDVDAPLFPIRFYRVQSP